MNLKWFIKNWIVLAIFALILVVNYLLSFATVRLDLSKGQAYTLSPASRKIIKNIDGNATITLYASSELPSRLVPIRRDVMDLLGEYRTQSGGKINVVVADPKKDEKKLQQAQEYGVREVQFSQQEQDKLAVSTSYFGIGIQYKDKKEAIPVVTSPTELEYTLTSLLYKMTNKNPVVVGVVGLTSQDALQLNTLTTLLNQQFDITQYATAEVKYKTLLVLDSQSKEYGDDEVKLFDTYLAGGGKAIFFVDGVWIADQAATASGANHGLFDLFRKWGIDLQKDLVLSASSEIVNLGGSDGFPIATQYPFWVVTNTFEGPTSYFSNVQAVSFPWASSIKLTKQNGIDVMPLIKTDLQSWHQTSTFALDPSGVPQPKTTDLAQFTVGAMAKNPKTGGAIILIPSSRFVQDQFVSRRVNNFEYALNLVSDLASDGLLSGIKQRSVDVYPLPTLSESAKDMFKYLNMILLPGAFAAYGIYRLTRKKLN